MPWYIGEEDIEVIVGLGVHDCVVDGEGVSTEAHSAVISQVLIWVLSAEQTLHSSQVQVSSVQVASAVQDCDSSGDGVSTSGQSDTNSQVLF